MSNWEQYHHATCKAPHGPIGYPGCICKVVTADDAMDAARWRWLKANHLQTGSDSWIRTGEDLEEAVDAGMKRS